MQGLMGPYFVTNILPFKDFHSFVRIYSTVGRSSNNGVVFVLYQLQFRCLVIFTPLLNDRPIA
jgi:hypothetical protein